jgi:hypothetical protein
MKYVITTERPFPEIEILAIGALERLGIVVKRTFSLHSATRTESASRNPGYSVFMIYGTGASQQSRGLLTIYQRGGRTVINPVLTSQADVDLDADLVAALTVSGLEFCVDVTGNEKCINLRLTDEETGTEHE